MEKLVEKIASHFKGKNVTNLMMVNQTVYSSYSMDWSIVFGKQANGIYLKSTDAIFLGFLVQYDRLQYDFWLSYHTALLWTNLQYSSSALPRVTVSIIINVIIINLKFVIFQKVVAP